MDTDVGELATALQAMDDWDADLLELLGLSDADAHNVSSTALKSRQKKKLTGCRASRPRCAHKLEKLELEVEIHRLERFALQLKSEFQCEDNCSHDILALRVECEAMASRQRQQRLDAEIENTRLRILLASRFKGAGKIAALSRKLGTIQQVLGSSHTASMAEFRGPVLAVDHQLRQLDVFVAGAAGAFSRTRFTEITGGVFRGLRFRKCESSGVEADFAIVYELPFPLETVASALWIQTTRLNRVDRTMDFEDIYEAPNILVSRFVIEPRDRASCSDLSDPTQSHGQIASRLEYDPSDGSFLIVSTVQGNVFKPNDESKGYLKGDGFLRVEPISDQLTRVKWCRNVQGFPPEYVSNSKIARRRWVDDLVKGPARQIWRRNLESSVQAVENRLLMWSQTQQTV